MRKSPKNVWSYQIPFTVIRRYQSSLIILCMMGKRIPLYEIFYAALDAVKAKWQTKRSLPLRFGNRLDNITPQVEVKSRRVGGATFPGSLLKYVQTVRKAYQWKYDSLRARKRGGKTMADKLASEIMDAFNNQGGAYKRKEDMHRMAWSKTVLCPFQILIFIR